MRLSKATPLLRSLLTHTSKLYLATLIRPLAVSRPNNLAPFPFTPKSSFSTHVLHKNALKSNY
jgi:hypothetical protein